jgi:GDPmannose 4,6-dehydratase
MVKNNLQKSALITGISGQDGSILAEYLLEKDYVVHGLVRPTSNVDNIKHLLVNPNLKIIWGDLMNVDLLRYVLSNYKIQELYNLASQSNVRLSYEDPGHTFEVTLLGTISLIEAVKKYSPLTRIFQAGSSAMFGESCDDDGFQREETKFKPISPYASSKLFAHNICQNYRKNDGMYISNGIFYNHESYKNKRNLGIISTLVDKALLISEGEINNFFIPNLNTTIDFGHANDFVEAMWLVTQQEQPDDYIISSGQIISIKELCDYIFSELGMNYKEHITTNEQNDNCFIAKGDSSKIRSIGWLPKINIYEMIDEIINKRKQSQK